MAGVLDHYHGTMNTETVDVCTMYFFLYHDDFYAPLKIKSLFWIHTHIQKWKNKLLPSQVALQKNISCGGHSLLSTGIMFQIFKHDVPVANACHCDSAPHPQKSKQENIMRNWNCRWTLKKGWSLDKILHSGTAKKHSHVKPMCAAFRETSLSHCWPV